MASTLTDIKIGRILKLKGAPCLVLTAQFLRKQQRKPVMRTKLKNLINGATVEKTFSAGEDFELAEIETRKCQYLYKDNEKAFFMDQTNYEQFEIPINTIEEQMCFLLDGMDIMVVFFEGNPISVELPVKVDLKIIDTSPGVRGDTASGGGKPATLETGLTIQVPLFIKIGDIVKVNTETHEYVERVTK